MKKLLPLCMIVLTGFMVLPQQATAQWSIGASYEMRQEVPENGFGLRVERSILNPVPIVDIALRAHFSYFSEENGVTESGASFGEIKNYDLGLAAIGGVSLGLLKPYVGLGLGSNTFDVSGGDFQNAQNTSESALFWNALVGTEVSIIPKLKPFVEYRFQQTDEPNFDPSINSDGRLVLGLSLQF